MTTEMERARRLVAEADRIVVLTGAGISAESGVPTFRGAGGLWKSHRPEELATPEAARGADPSPALPVEVHGAIDRDKCSSCGARTPGTSSVDTSSHGVLPRCSTCNGMLRPDVVWFGETLEPEILSRAFQVAQDADLCLVVGTSALVQPAALVPLVTLQNGGALIEVNIERTPLSGEARVSLLGPSGELLPELLDVGAAT